MQCEATQASPSVTIGYIGNCALPLLILAYCPWVVDVGASDHVAGNSSILLIA